MPARAGEQNVARFYLKYLVGIASGNLGMSTRSDNLCARCCEIVFRLPCDW